MAYFIFSDVDKINKQINELNVEVRRAELADPSMKRKLMDKMETLRAQLNADIADQLRVGMK